MLASERHAHILAELERNGSVRVSDLVRRLGVSDMTIRRDLETLQRSGLVHKVHGGATFRAEPTTEEPGFAVKSRRQLREKAAIGARAAAMVEPGSAVAISAGTTTHALARHLVAVPSLTVITNSVWVADILHSAGSADTTVVLTGGMRTPSDALVGPIAVDALRKLHADVVFMGVHGMDAKAGFTTPNLMESETNRAMVDCGRRMIVVADSTKWGVLGVSSFAELEDADVVVSDAGLSEDAAALLGERVGELVLVDPDQGPADDSSTGDPPTVTERPRQDSNLRPSD